MLRDKIKKKILCTNKYQHPKCNPIISWRNDQPVRISYQRKETWRIDHLKRYIYFTKDSKDKNNIFEAIDEVKEEIACFKSLFEDVFICFADGLFEERPTIIIKDATQNFAKK